MESDGLKVIVTRRVAVWENSKVGRVVLVRWLWAGSLGLWINWDVMLWID